MFGLPVNRLEKPRAYDGMKNKTAARLKSWFWGLNLLIPIALIVVSSVDLAEFLLEPDAYPIGWEGGGWRYRTNENYVLSSVAFIAGASLAVYGAIRVENVLVRWSARAACLLVSFYILLPMFVWLLHWLDLVPLQFAAAIHEGHWGYAYDWLLALWDWGQ